MVDKTNLTRFPILDIRQELIDNQISSGRHSEIINFFESNLQDKEYYCISQYNPVRPKNANLLSGICSRTFRAGKQSNYFVASECEVEGCQTNVIVQKVYPKTAHDFYMADNGYVVYVSKKAIDKYLLTAESK